MYGGHPLERRMGGLFSPFPGLVNIYTLKIDGRLVMNQQKLHESDPRSILARTFMNIKEIT